MKTRSSSRSLESTSVSGELRSKYLPAGASGNTAELQLQDGTTALQLVARLGMPAETNYLITLNGAIVPMSQRESTALSDKDELAILPPLKGG